jgi:predicted ATPase
MLEATEFQQFLAGVPKALFAELHPICPLRGFEEWGYPLPEAPAPNLDRLSLTERAVALASVLAYNRDIEKALSQWLEDLIEVRIEVKLLPGKRVTIRCKPSSSGASDNLFLNEGTGASQLPFILIPIGLAHRNETILLSEPEAHLHPRLQSHLMQALLGIAKRETKQFLIETHSEHVLHVLLNAVAKGDLQKSELAIYYFENVNGEAKVRRLEVNEHGQVEGGLPGFFDQSLAELTEYLEALKKS